MNNDSHDLYLTGDGSSVWADVPTRNSSITSQTIDVPQSTTENVAVTDTPLIDDADSIPINDVDTPGISADVKLKPVQEPATTPEETSSDPVAVDLPHQVSNLKLASLPTPVNTTTTHDHPLAMPQVHPEPKVPENISLPLEERSLPPPPMDEIRVDDAASTTGIPPSNSSTTAVMEDNSSSSVIDPLQQSVQVPLDDSNETRKSPEPVSNQSSSSLPTFAFDISVHSPLKISEALGSHIQYTVSTKTTSPHFRNSTFSVSRRFKDFLWLYNALLSKYPGVIIPPVPEKVAIGRFENEFIEARRIGLERFVKKITCHPSLQSDSDVQLFLESETFTADKRKDDKKGFLSFAESQTTPSLHQPFPKIPDPNVYPILETRQKEFEALESQLKLIQKSLDGYVKFRRELAGALFEMGESLMGLVAFQEDAVLVKKLSRLGHIHRRLKDLHEQQAKYDLEHISGTVEEHLRIIGSVKVAYAQRLKAYNRISAAESSLAKKKDVLSKLSSSSKIRVDKIAVAKVEVGDAEKELEDLSLSYKSLTETLIHELDKTDKEKISDFTETVKTFFSSMLSTQKEIVKAWESYTEVENESASRAEETNTTD